MSESLKDRGFRLVWGDNGLWTWRHPQDVEQTDIDVTEMSDEELERLVNDLR